MLISYATNNGSARAQYENNRQTNSYKPPAFAVGNLWNNPFCLLDISFLLTSSLRLSVAMRALEFEGYVVFMAAVKIADAVASSARVTSLSRLMELNSIAR